MEMIAGVEPVEPPAELTQNFHRHSGLTFAWRGLAPHETIAGEFSLCHIAEAFLNGPNAWLEDAARSEEEEELVEQLRVFESQPFGGVGTMTALRLAGENVSPEIWYFDMTCGLMRLYLDYGEYLELLLRTKGLYYWQYLFTDPHQAELTLETVLPGLRSGLEFLVRVFPEDQLSDLFTRLVVCERALSEPQ